MQGLGHTTMYCGDGINDLPALSAADVGFAIAATEAAVAADAMTKQGSIAGMQHSACMLMFLCCVLHTTVSQVACHCHVSLQ